MYTEHVKIRFCETDALGHVNNTVLPIWFESAREPIFKIFSPNLDISKWTLILASYKVDFLKPIFYGSPVMVTTEIARVGGASFDVKQHVWQDQHVAAVGLTTMVYFNYQSNQSEPIPDEIRATLNQHLIVKSTKDNS